MTATPMPPVLCPSCNTPLDMATSLESNEPPMDGDVTICLQCGHIMVFENNRPRDPNHDELRIIAGAPKILRAQRARVAGKEKQNAKKI
jgi:RNase P subunit RPR2